MRLLLPTMLLALAATPAPATEPPTQSRAEVLALPPQQAADALLRNIAPRFVTMTGQEGADNGDFLTPLHFATAPEGTGIAGLCRAKVLNVTLEHSQDAAAPPLVWSFGFTDVYKAVGDVDAPLGPIDPGEREQARRCAAAGPVLASPPDSPHAPRFFAYRGYGEPWLGVTALQGAIRAAREGRYGAIECSRRELTDCRDPRAEFAALDVRDLSYVEVVQPDRDQPNFIVHASFVAEGDRDFHFGWQVLLEVNGEPLPIRRSSIFTFNNGRTRLFRY